MQFGLGRARWAGAGMYAAAVVALSLLTGAAALTAMNALLQAASRTAHSEIGARPRPGADVTLQQSRSGRVVLTQDDWVERIQRKDYWEGRGGSGSGPSRPNSSKSSAPSKLGASGTAGPSQDPSVSAREASRSFSSGSDWDGTYRTMCVRVCDGYFFPISFSTTDDNFERDQARCEASCSSPARLFVYKNPGEEIEEMKDLDGTPYTRLLTAFLFRQKYDSACKCTPHPWEPQALDRHRLYALEATGRKGDREAAKAAAELRIQLGADDRRQKSQKKPGGLQSAVDGTAGSALEDQQPSVRAQRAKRKQSNPAANAVRGSSSGARSPDLMRLGAAPSNNQIRSSGGKPTSASRVLKGARQQPWQVLVFENR